MSAQLPPNPSIEQLKKQAKDLRKACQSGDAGALVRVREHLPRLAQASDAEIRAAEVVLQEAQHVIATEHGFKNWNWLQAVVEVDFDVLARLPDREIQTLMHEADQKDVVVSLTSASDAAKSKFLRNMSERVRGFVTEEMPSLRPAPAQVVEVQRQVLMQAAELASLGQIDWPCGNGAATSEEDSAQVAEPSARLLELAGSRLDALSTDAVVELMAEVAELGRRHGILALDPVAEQMVDPFVQEALRLAVDETEPDLLTDMLETRSEQALLRQRMVATGMAALQRGRTPAEVEAEVRGAASKG